MLNDPSIDMLFKKQNTRKYTLIIVPKNREYVLLSKKKRETFEE